jgi:multisubunit Na+/H+ antiporter MnhB subunit
MKHLSNKKLKVILSIVVGLQVLLVTGVAFYLKRGDPSSVVKNSSDFSMFPIWVAVFIPLFIATKKKQVSEEEKRRGLFIALGLGLVFLLGISVFFIATK